MLLVTTLPPLVKLRAIELVVAAVLVSVIVFVVVETTVLVLVELGPVVLLLPVPLIVDGPTPHKPPARAIGFDVVENVIAPPMVPPSKPPLLVLLEITFPPLLTVSVNALVVVAKLVARSVEVSVRTLVLLLAEFGPVVLLDPVNVSFPANVRPAPVPTTTPTDKTATFTIWLILFRFII